MRIPIGGQGFDTVRVGERGRAVPVEAFTRTADAISRAGAELEQIADRQGSIELAEARQEQAEQRAEERQRAAEAKRNAQQVERNQAGIALARFEADAGEAARALGLAVSRGELSPSAALDQFSAHENASRASHFKGIDPILAQAFEDTVIRVGTRARDSILAVGERQAQEKRRSTFGTMIEEFQRLAITDPDGAVRRARAAFEIEGRAIFGPEDAQRGLQRFEETVARMQATTLVNHDPRRAVANLRNPSFLPALDPQQRTSLVAVAEQRVAVAQQQAQAAAERIATANEREFNAHARILEAGQVLDAATVSALTARFRGTQFAEPFARMVAAAPAAQRFSAQPIAEQERALLEMRARGNTAGWSRAEAEQHERLAREFEARRRAIREDAMHAALSHGIIPRIAPLTLDLAALPQQLSERVAQATEIERRWTGAPVSPLRPEETAWLARSLRAMQPRDQVDAVRVVTREMSDGQVRALAEQMGRDGVPALPSIALHVRRNTRTALGGPVAEMIARGQALIDTRTVKLDQRAEVGLRSQIREMVRGAFPTTLAEDMAVEDAYRIAAAQHADGHDATSTRNVRNAVALATGGIWEHNGVRTTARYGASPSHMRALVQAQTPEMLERRAGGSFLLMGDEPVSAAQLHRMRGLMQFTATGTPGEFAVSIGGRMVIRAQDGRPFITELWRE